MMDSCACSNQASKRTRNSQRDIAGAVGASAGNEKNTNHPGSIDDKLLICSSSGRCSYFDKEHASREAATAAVDIQRCV